MTELKCLCKLEKILLVSLIILVLILTGSLLFVAIKLAVTPASCNSPACVLAAAQILTFVDPSADPCNDFFKFACGKYMQTHFGDTTAAPMQLLQTQVERQVQAIINEPIKNNDHYLVKIEKELFQACMNETVVEEESLPVFKAMLDELNGWPVINGHHWNDTLFNWRDMIYKLRQNGYTFSMMLTIGPVANPSNASQYIIRIEQPYIPLTTGRKKELYKNYMTDVAVIFGAERNFAEKEMQKVADFMERLRKIGDLNEWKIRKGNSSDNDHNEALLKTRLTVEEFQNRHNDIDWLDFINNILYPAAKLSLDDYVIFPKDEFVAQFFDLLYKTPKRTQANYIIWTALTYVMPFMPKELKECKQNYTYFLRGRTEPPDERFEFCRTEISAKFYPEPAKLLYVRKYLPIEKREKVRQMLANVKSEFIALLEKNSWMDKESKAKAVEKAHALIGVIGAPGDYFEDAAFETFEFQKANFQKGSFLKMLLSHIKQQVNSSFFLLYRLVGDTKLALFYYLLTRVLAMHAWTENAIFLPAGILQGVFYDENRPMYLNYGGIGSVIGHELTHGFGKDGSRYDKDGNEANIWLEETKAAYLEKTKCLIQNAEDAMNEIDGIQTMEENIADLTGVKVSYAAYKKWVQTNGEENQLTGIKYTPYQLFWISSVLHYCYKRSDEELSQSSKYAEHANNIFRAIEPLRNNPDFANDFNCPEGSRMNPLTKCQLF